MDLRYRSVPASAAEIEALDAVLADAPAAGLASGVGDRAIVGGHVARSRRHLLLPALHALQDRVGHITEGGLDEICRRLTIPPADAFGVASFYALLALEPRPARRVHVCVDLACVLSGAEALVEELEASRDPAAVVRSPCLGLCERAPAALVIEAGVVPRHAVIGHASVDAVDAFDAVDAGEQPRADPPRVYADRPVLLRRVGVVDPASLADYRANGGYTALARSAEIGRDAVIDEVNRSKLLGRGGAAFPAGRKWEAVAAQPVAPHYVVCNADESEPGTFKDRVLMEHDPYSVIEAMTIAGYATRANEGWIYLRAEYPIAYERLSQAIARCREAGLLGDDVDGYGFRFDIHVFRGAGAYICGEETAIFNSIEGYRGEPRSKPPFPVEVGLYGKPTLVNNVETLVNVLPIVLGGGDAYARTGTGPDGSTGTKLFAVSGCVRLPGVYEVAFGETLGGLIERAGGMRDPAHPLRAVLLGGAAGSFVTPDEIDLALTFEAVRAAGASLGSGVVMVLDDKVEMAPFVHRIASFFRDESCGQCVPCRVGTVRQEELLHRLAAGAPIGSVDDELALLADLGQVMRDASICGLGQTAAAAIASAFEKGLV